MKVVALISGGKDSCYNMMLCVAAGHEIIALANLQPANKEDELDSYMYQTVGHEGISLYAEAMGLPLYRATTRGRACSQEMVYSPTAGDEVEDLYQLIGRVKAELGVEGVSSGAILSNYQRLRVENVCSRLGVVSLSYLWRREQSELLQEMVAAGVRAVVIKVAAMGLSPEKHLGKTVEELYPHLAELHVQYGINVCGEGGEYETFTIDCPLFKKKIIIDESEMRVHSDDAFAPVAYLKLKQLHLEEKHNETPGITVSPYTCQLLFPARVPMAMPVRQQAQCVCRGEYRWLVCDGDPHIISVAEQTEELFATLQGPLSGSGCGWKDVALVYLYLRDMTQYAEINAVYGGYFPSQPPARVCVQLPLPEGVMVRVEMVACGGDEYSSMHIQSLSHWAPANIGPYSQTYTIRETVFASGQIGLEPANMVLANEEEQPSLSLTHAFTVLRACHAHLDSALCGLCYYTHQKAGWLARKTWQLYMAGKSGCEVCFLPVSALPRGACVEWHFIALKSSHTITYSTVSDLEEKVGVVTLHQALSDQMGIGCWVVSVAPLPSSHPPVILTALKSGLRKLLSSHYLSLEQVTFLRVCLPRHASGQSVTVEDIAGVLGSSNLSLSLMVTEGFFGHDTPIVIQVL